MVRPKWIKIKYVDRITKLTIFYFYIKYNPLSASSGKYSKKAREIKKSNQLKSLQKKYAEIDMAYTGLPPKICIEYLGK